MVISIRRFCSRILIWSFCLTILDIPMLTSVMKSGRMSFRILSKIPRICLRTRMKLMIFGTTLIHFLLLRRLLMEIFSRLRRNLIGSTWLMLSMMRSGMVSFCKPMMKPATGIHSKIQRIDSRMKKLIGATLVHFLRLRRIFLRLRRILIGRMRPK